MCEQLKITWSQIQTLGRMGKNAPGDVPVQVIRANDVFFLDELHNSDVLLRTTKNINAGTIIL
jgi:hypothetical protein